MYLGEYLQTRSQRNTFVLFDILMALRRNYFFLATIRYRGAERRPWVRGWESSDHYGALGREGEIEEKIVDAQTIPRVKSSKI